MGEGGAKAAKGSRRDGRGLVVRDLSVRRGDALVVDRASLRGEPGEVIALVGPSGAGKSSLLRALAGLEPYEAEELRVGAHDFTSPSRRAPRERALVGFVFQDHHLFEHLDVLANVTLAPRLVLGEAEASAEERAREILRRLSIDELRARRLSELSGGQRQRAAIARALAMRPEVLLLDEPTASLDQASRDEVTRLLEDLCDDGLVVLVATHDLALARAAARTLELRGGVLSTREEATGEPGGGAAPDEVG
jgi:ABC-type polar amino acid transport system ATPase subunit